MMTDPDTGGVTVLDPRLFAEASNVISPRLPTLDDVTLGVIWNGRPEGELILREMLAILGSRYALREVVMRTKPHIGNVAPDELLREVAETCDAVVAGVGDCGSCCPASVLDAIAMERLGVPAVMVGAERLVATVGRGMAKVQGVPDFPLAVIHGSGQLARLDEEHDHDTVVAYAADLAAQVEAILLFGRVAPLAAAG